MLQEFELTYDDVTVQYFSHYAKKTSQKKKEEEKEEKEEEKEKDDNDSYDEEEEEEDWLVGWLYFTVYQPLSAI